ncbi:hypothetical protein BJX96DRAFT_167603 [Aspergillus floccosus]
MDPFTIIGLVSNIISFIDFGRKLLTDVREIQNSAAGVTQDVLNYRLITQQMRDFADKLIPAGKDVDDEYKGIISLAKHWLRLQSLGSGIKSLRYGKEISSLLVKIDRYRDQLLVRAQIEELARDFDKNGGRIIKLQKQMEELDRSIKTTNDRLSQGIQDLLGLSYCSYIAVHSHRLLENLRLNEMNARFETVPYAHERTFEWIFSRRENGNDHDKEASNEESDEEHNDRDGSNHEKIREGFTSWLSSEDGIYHISGKLGSGKSALMKFLYLDPRTKNMLEKWAGYGTLIMANFFFWRPGSRLQHSVRGLYRALLYKTLSEVPTLIPEVLPEQWKEIQSKPWQVNVTVDFSLKTLQQASSRLMCCQTEDLRICLFIDGLDECEHNERKESDTDQHRHLAQSLSRWCAEFKGRVKICASSREYNVFLENLPSERRLHMQRLTEEDMKIYIRDRMRFARQIERSAELIDSIIDKANGIFLWVALVTSRIQYLHESKVSWDILKKEIDEALEGLYNLFNHIVQSLTASDLRRAYRTFAIMQKLGEYELSLPLLSYPFIGHYSGDSDVDSCEISRQERMPESDRLQQARGMLVGYCGGLFEPTQTSYRFVGSEKIISFTHRSVPEFIKQLDINEEEKHLRAFCVEDEDAASYLLLAYLWAKDIGNLPRENEDTGSQWMSYISLRIIEMRRDAKIGKVPFNFEEQIWSVLSRLGAKIVTERDTYGLLLLRAGVSGNYVIVRNHTHASYFMSHPFYLSAWADNLEYVQWKLAHDPSVTQTPFQIILLFYCLRYSCIGEEAAILYQILDMLRDRGLSPQTMTTLSPSAYLQLDDYVEITVWQHLIVACLEGMSRTRLFWRWLLENGADPYFIVSCPQEEWDNKESAQCTLVLGRERRRLDTIYIQQNFDGPLTSKKYPNPDGTGIRMMLIDLIREMHFEREEELIELVERNMWLFGDEPEKIESSRGILEGVVEEEAGDTTPANKAEIAALHDEALPRFKGKGTILSAYILGLLSAVVVAYLISALRF